MPLVTPATAARHQTKQEFVYQTLRRAILACELQPGEGLVASVPHVGAAVAPISRESIVDVFTVLEGLELMATRLVAQEGSAPALHTLTRLVAVMDTAAQGERFEEWADLNTRFHHAIAAATGLPLLLEMTDRV